MPQFRTTRRVRHPAADMFALVADVERYPQFVPLCQGLKVLSRAEGPDGTQVLTANMTVAYKLIHETFTSQVTLDRANLTINVKYLNGPFSHLDNRWIFRPLGDDLCDVEFFIAYEFKSSTLGFLMGSVFEAAFRRFAEAFESRADTAYGSGKAALREAR
jgi:coenzyme Q-binding protein COQ10